MRKLLIFLAILLAALFGLWRSNVIESALLLSDLGAGARPTLYKKLTPAPERRQVGYAVAGRRHLADLYLPAEKAGAAIVLVPGAAKEGKDDPRLVALASSLARARFLVLVPDIPSLRALEVSAADREPIADAVRFLAEERKPPAIGIAAISYAAAPAILA
ncbi:MAG TPA: alpha/beta hydrolase, partial [Candidatus Omnitrophota bacterium]|nr:alpha/beta hydrolase [Candidatus Omnitrophota bacterium]